MTTEHELEQIERVATACQNAEDCWDKSSGVLFWEAIAKAAIAAYHAPRIKTEAERVEEVLRAERN